MKPCANEPCRECPFRRASLPGWLGAATPPEFILETEADSEMPCHLTVKYEDANWEEKMRASTSVRQCSGAAIYFANRLKVSKDPKRRRLPSDFKRVFHSAAEFLEHHERGALTLALKPMTVKPKKTKPEKFPKPVEKTDRPARGDKSDQRCAFVVEATSACCAVGNRDWCYGCDFYVCDHCCDQNIEVPMGKHDVTEHLEQEEDDE